MSHQCRWGCRSLELPITGHGDLRPARYVVVCPEEMCRSPPLSDQLNFHCPDSMMQRLGSATACRRIQVGNEGASRFFQAIPRQLRVFPLVSQLARHSLEMCLAQDYLMPLTVIPPMM